MITRIICVVALATTGCIGPFAPCADNAGQFGINVVAVDARTGNPPSTQVTMIVTDGPYADTAVRSLGSGENRLVLHAADDRAGTYSIVITSPGYATWTRDAVLVKRGDCNPVTPVVLTASLQPVP